MFETVDSAEMSAHPSLALSGQRLWSYVTQRLHVPWFYVVYRFDLPEGGSLRNMLLATSVDHLIDAVQQADIEIVEANVVLPAHVTGKRQWVMEPLIEIWEGTEPESEARPAYVYVTANSVRYVYSSLGSQESELSDLRLAFASENCGAS